MTRFAAPLLVLLSTIPVLTEAGVHTTSDARVEMRDGVELSADIWLPGKEGRFPTILLRTPYTKDARFLDPPHLGEFFAGHGYAVVVQDVRGKGLSEGLFRDGHQEPNDGYDSVEWIARQDWSDGRVCMMGLSYLGWVQWLAAKAQPPHLTCIVPTASPGFPFLDTPYRGGVFMTGLLPWAWGNTVADGSEATEPDWDQVMAQRPLNKLDQIAGREVWLFQDWVRHQTLDDYWLPITLLPEDYAQIELPTLSVSGWYDDTIVGAMSHYYGMKGSPAADRQHLLLGPWTHGQTFTGGSTRVRGIELGADSVLDMRNVHLAFFEHYLKRNPAAPRPAYARIYVTGSNRWIESDHYPPENTQWKQLHLSSGGKANTVEGDGVLLWELPREASQDQYDFDPADPAPIHPADQFLDDEVTEAELKELDYRQDVLIYTSAPLESDLTVVGPMSLTLSAATNARDTDFVARLLDVDPTGAEIKPTAPDGAIRARYRSGFDQQVLVTPGSIERYDIEMFDIGHTFRKGHRIRLQLTSSAFPILHPNPNTGNPIPGDTDYQVATQSIFHGQTNASFLSLPVFMDNAMADAAE